MTVGIRPVLEGVRAASRNRLRTLLLMSIATSACVTGPVVGFGETPPAERHLPASTRQLVVAVVDDLGTPLPGAQVTFVDDTGSHVVLSDAEGRAAHDWQTGPVSVLAEAPGLMAGEAVVVDRPDVPFSLALHPIVLRGFVTDPAGHPLSGAQLSLGGSETRSGTDGSFQLQRAVPGDVVVRRPSRATLATAWDGSDALMQVILRPRVIRGLHVSADAARDPTRWTELLRVADETVIDGFVIDVKDDTGRVFHDSLVEPAVQGGAVMAWLDLPRLLSDVRQHELYAIARIVAFIDPLAAQSFPSMAVWDQDRDAPFRRSGQVYLDPTDEGARQYALDLAAEACRAGFDEVQFDHVTYPVLEIGSTALFDEGTSEQAKVGAIRSFLAEASTLLNREGCAVAANVLGFTGSINFDGGIGQNFRALTEVTDVMSPTLYPNHYGEGWFGLDNPSQHPGTVVGRALDDAVTRINGPAIIRPWLQDFSYGSSAVRAQIAAAEDRGLGWMLWNAQSSFTLEALDPSPESPSEGPG